MSESIDVDAYFARIGFDGTASPDLATLKALHALHPAAIPFEGLDPLLGRPVALDLRSLEAKLLHRRRGGYCFEHNSLFAAALDAIGFKVARLAARVRWNAPPHGPPTPRTHMILQVDLAEGAYLADVGFGGQTQTAPLRLVLDDVQATPHGDYRFVRLNGLYQLEARIDDEWRATFQFNFEPQAPADYEVANWYTSAHPKSVFRNNLMMAFVGDGERYALMNRVFTRRPVSGPAEVLRLDSATALAKVLEDVFRIEPPAPAKAIFARLPI